MSPAIDRLFQEPFVSRWIFDVEILARFLRGLRGTATTSADEVIHEIPLLRWDDVAGSKVRPLDFLKAIFELAMIRYVGLRQHVAPPRSIPRPRSLAPRRVARAANPRSRERAQP
jgi:hypothetical protein